MVNGCLAGHDNSMIARGTSLVSLRVVASTCAVATPFSATPVPMAHIMWRSIVRAIAQWALETESKSAVQVGCLSG